MSTTRLLVFVYRHLVIVLACLFIVVRDRTRHRRVNERDDIITILLPSIRSNEEVEAEIPHVESQTV